MVGLKFFGYELEESRSLCRNGRKPDGGIEIVKMCDRVVVFWDVGMAGSPMVGLKWNFAPAAGGLAGVGMAGSPMVGLKSLRHAGARRADHCRRNGRKPDGGIEIHRFYAYSCL